MTKDTPKLLEAALFLQRYFTTLQERGFPRRGSAKRTAWREAAAHLCNTLVSLGCLFEALGYAATRGVVDEYAGDPPLVLWCSPQLAIDTIACLRADVRVNLQLSVASPQAHQMAEFVLGWCLRIALVWSTGVCELPREDAADDLAQHLLALFGTTLIRPANVGAS